MTHDRTRTTESTRRRTAGPPRRTALAVALAAVALTAAGPAAVAGASATQSGTFAVSIDRTNSPVTAGEELTVTATVENTGAYSGSQSVSLRVGGREVDATETTLAPDESATVTLTWATGEGDAGNYTATVATDDDTAERDVVVEEASGMDGGNDTSSPAKFAVGVAATNSPVTEGDRMEVTATVENTGDTTATQNVSLRIGAAGEVLDSKRVSLGKSENRTVTLTWQTASGDAGNYTATVATANDTAERDVEVREARTTNAPPTVSVDHEPASPGVGDDVVLTADASDPDGNVTSYRWTVDGEVVSTDASLSHTFEESGEHEVAVTVTDDRGANASATVTVTVESANEPPTASVSAEPSSPTAGEEVTFQADASDPDGNVTSYEWVVDGEVVSDSRTLSYTFEEAGAHEVVVRVTDDEGATAGASRTLEVVAESVVTTTEQPPADAPGFGAVAALAALVGGALAVARRRRT